MKNMAIWYALVLSTFLFDSCAKKQDEGARDAADVVAVIGTECITTADLTKVLRSSPPSNQVEYLTGEGKRTLVEMMIDWHLMSREAVKAGLNRREDIQTRLATDADSSVINKQVLSNAYLQYRLQQMDPVTDEAAEQYFTSHKNEFFMPERVKVKRIIFDDREKAQEALSAFGKGLSFEEFKQHNAGIRTKIDTIWLQRTEAGSEMERTAFSLQEGAISDIGAAQKGYYILRIEEKSPCRTQSFSEIKETLRSRLQHEREQQLLEKIRKELRGKISITIYEGVLDSYQCKECG
jgi:hypothetical protein